MTDWDKILSERSYSLEEPDNVVIDLLERKKKGRTLDLASGAGRHVVYMARRGFETNGADLSNIGLRTARERLRKRGLEASIVKCDMNHLPYVDSCFDIIVCMRAIYHQKITGIQETISEIQRILTKRGTVLMDFLTKRTQSYGKGQEVEKDTFVETEGFEKGILHHFTDKQEIEYLFRNFKTTSITLKETEVGGRHSRFTVTASV